MNESATEARLVAAACILAALFLSAIGFFVVPDVYTADLTSLVPLLLGTMGFLLVVLLVDPALTPKETPTADEVRLFLSRTFVSRMPFALLPGVAGLTTAVMHQSRSPLVLGAVGTMMLAAVWWPGEQFLSGMRRRLAPMSAGHLVDEALADSDGRLRLVKPAR